MSTTREDREAAAAYEHADSVRRLESARLFAIKRGWAEHCGWTLGSSPSVDDGISAAVARGSVGKARKALGNAVVVRCAEVVGKAVMDAIGSEASE